MKRILSALTCAVTAVLVTASVAGTAAAAAPDAPSQRPVYLAIGDSLAAGQQSSPPAGTFESTVRRWKAQGFVAQFHDTLRERLDCRADTPTGRGRDGCPHLQLVNLARTGIPGVPGSGVTTRTLLTPGDQLDRALAVIRERRGDDSARNDVEVISLTVGGNDLFAPAVAACVQGSGPATCASTLGATFAAFEVRYHRILGELRAAAGDDVLIMTTTYDNPLPFCVLGAADPFAADALGTVILEGGDLPGVGTLAFGFNDVIRAVSARHGAVVGDTFGALGAGDFVGGADCLHPDADGHATIAGVFAAALPR